jgi:hypothetical protein
VASKIPPEAIGYLITFLMIAQSRGLFDVRGLEPLLRIVVDSGNAPNIRALLGEVLQTLERVESEIR